MINVGILGCGNMGSAIMHGLASRNDLRENFSILAFDHNPERCSGAHIRTMPDAASLAREADFLILALKPQHIPAVLPALVPELGKGKTLISIAAGLDIKTLRELCNGSCAVVRVMPNTPALVGQGMFGICFDDPEVLEKDKKAVNLLFSALGSVFIVPELRFNAFSTISGCGPAYVFYFMEAIVEGAVALGFSRQEATSIVYGLFRGSTTLAEESGKHLAELREQVCSPAGMTIAGMNHLDRTALRGNIIDALFASERRGKELGS